ncbi:MAG: alpha-D-glucose phosphate-specific phosphoglucomutase, partial [Gammaproteobacteria bacterium]
MSVEKISPLAGKQAPVSILVDVAKLLAAYADVHPDPGNPAQRVAFGTSGHRGSSLDGSFNEWHIYAITQAICDYRAQESVTGPLYIGYDTHALSKPAFKTALEVLAANDVEVRTSKGGEFTPTPVISHAILCHNRGRDSGLADGIVITPSHNPPDNGGFKYNPVNGGPAGTGITSWVQKQANQYLVNRLAGVRRVPFVQACTAATTQTHDFLDAYVSDLANVIDFDAIRGAGLKLAVDPLGGAGVHYWAPIAERYKIDLTVVSEEVDPRFAFMTVDWDGKIRMDPSSEYAMQRLLALKDKYDVAFACDTDHDRHGIVTRSTGLLKANHYLSVMIDFLFRERRHWPETVAIGKTVVSTALIDRVAKKLKRKLYEVPVGFKWFAPKLFDGSLAFGGEESAGASFLRQDGTVWTTDKDGIV